MACLGAGSGAQKPCLWAVSGGQTPCLGAGSGGQTPCLGAGSGAQTPCLVPVLMLWTDGSAGRGLACTGYKRVPKVCAGDYV